MTAPVTDETQESPVDDDETGNELDAAEQPDESGADDEPETPDEPEQPEQPAEGRTPAEVEASYKKVEKAYKRYQETIERELADVLPQTAPCPLCDPALPGFVVPSSIADEQRFATLDLLQQPRDDQFIPDKYTTTCPDCDGWGNTLTGAKNEQSRTRMCPKCSGTGWVNNSELHSNVVTLPVNDNSGTATPAAPVEKPWGSEYGVSHDLMGRPPGHPDYWKAPGAPATA